MNCNAVIYNNNNNTINYNNGTLFITINNKNYEKKITTEIIEYLLNYIIYINNIDLKVNLLIKIETLSINPLEIFENIKKFLLSLIEADTKNINCFGIIINNRIIKNNIKLLLKLNNIKKPFIITKKHEKAINFLNNNNNNL